MAASSTRGLFIVGTDTGVGKTYVAARIAAALAAGGHRVGVYKPVASGCRPAGDRLVSDDATALWQAAGRPGELAAVCPQCYRAPLAPPLAARCEGKQVDPALVRSGLDYWLRRSDIVLVEGTGGLMSPVAEDEYVADLAYEFGFPVVVVAPNVLGVINQTLQTLITAATFREGIKIAGVILNDVRPPAEQDASAAENRSELARRCVPPVLGHMRWAAVSFVPEIDWFALAAASRAGEA